MDYKMEHEALWRRFQEATTRIAELEAANIKLGRVVEIERHCADVLARQRDAALAKLRELKMSAEGHSTDAQEGI